MLRASAKAVGQPVDAVTAVTGGDVEQAVPHGPLLVSFVDAVVGGPGPAAEAARAALAEAATPAAVGEAAAIVANFEMMTRVADATGARVATERLASTEAERAALGVDAYRSAR
jgi:hypothetical protein